LELSAKMAVIISQDHLLGLVKLGHIIIKIKEKVS
jgi:hypothetical protein